MKKLIVFAIVTFAGICSGSLASAQSHQLRGHIPFDFTLGSARLSAGEYRITYDRSGQATFFNEESGRVVIALVGADQGTEDRSCELLFAQYDGQYFLKESRCNSAGANFFIPRSGTEKKALERAASNQGSQDKIVAMN